MFPKIAAVLGAHTELGKRVVRELLRNPYIEKIHALAEVDPRDEITIHPHDQHRLALYIEPLDYIEQIVSRYISKCHLAFCVLGGGKKDMAAMGAYQFHKMNLDIPRRFVHEMFALGVERIALLSHADASPKARGSEFLRVKGELEAIVRELQSVAAEHAPGVTVFKMPLIVTGLKDASGVKGKSITTADKIKQKAALKLELGSSRAVDVRDVAKAMVADTFQKLDMAEAGANVDPVFRRRDIRYAELDGQQVVHLAHQRRAVHREMSMHTRQQSVFDHRVSGYARQQADLGSAAPSSTRQSYTQTGEPAEYSGTHSSPLEESEANSNESFMSGSPPEEEDYVGEHQYEQSFHVAEESSYQQRPAAESLGPPSPLPSPEPRRFEYERSSGGDPRAFRSPERRRRSDPHVGSVEALGHQLGHRLTVMRNNEYLPDADLQSLPPSRSHHQRAYPSDPEIVGSGMPDTSQTASRPDAREFRNADLNIDRYGTNQPIHSHTPTSQSPPSGSPGRGTTQDSPVWSPEVPNRRLESPRRRYSGTSSGVDRRPHGRSHRSQRSTSGRNSAERYPDLYRGGRTYEIGSDYRGGIRSEKNGSRHSSLATRVTAFAERVIAATDRPSAQRDPRYTRRRSFREQNRGDADLEPPMRENGDMRPIGKTTI